MIGQRRNRNLFSGLLGGLGAAIGGAAAMYFFDPRLGHRRRVLVRDRGLHFARVGFNFVRGAVVDLGQRTRGLGYEVVRAFRNEPVPEEVLVARVRSALGHYLPSLHGIEVTASGDEITLIGGLNELDVPEVVRLVGTLPGVGTVHNRLSTINRETDARRAV